MKKRIIWTHEKCVILCMTLLIAIYTIALAVLPSHLEKDWGFYDGYWLKYLFQLVKMGIMTVFITKAYMHWRMGGRKKKVGFWLSLAFLILLLGNYYISIRDIQYALQKLCIAIWPIIVLILAMWIQRKEDKLCVGTFCYAKAWYYILVLFSVWFVTDVLSYINMFKRDISDMIYLFGCASIAWCIRKAFTNKAIVKTFRITWEMISNLLFSIASTLVLLVNHERFGQIVSSLKNPISNIEGTVEEVNWIGNRIKLMKQVWVQNLNLLENNSYHSNYDSSLVLVQQEFGWIATIAVLVIEGLLIYSLYRFYKENKMNGTNSIWIQMSFYTICFWTGFGFLMDVLVVTSSRIGLILLGNYECFVMILLFLYMIKNPLEKMVEKDSQNMK